VFLPIVTGLRQPYTTRAYTSRTSFSQSTNIILLVCSYNICYITHCQGHGCNFNIKNNDLPHIIRHLSNEHISCWIDSCKVPIYAEKFFPSNLITLFLAIHRLFEILGEAANRIPKDLQCKYSDIPWGTILGMRNIIVHIYDRVDIEMVWDTIKKDVPTIIKPLNIMLADLEKEEN